jgi:L-ribulose-5-phosphate 4-epimerase
VDPSAAGGDTGLLDDGRDGHPFLDQTEGLLHVLGHRLGQVGRLLPGAGRPAHQGGERCSAALRFFLVGGITHAHSSHAVAFAQAHRDIPVLGTTHADTFNGPIPVTRDLTRPECAKDYEYNTGVVIVDTLQEDDRKAAEVPAALVAGHGPFTWGADARKSLEHAIICEAVADIALHTMSLNPTAPPPAHLLERHYTRKHGPDAYYGNPEAALPKP